MPADCNKLLSFDSMKDVDENPRLLLENGNHWMDRKQKPAVKVDGSLHRIKGNIPFLC